MLLCQTFDQRSFITPSCIYKTLKYVIPYTVDTQPRVYFLQNCNSKD